MKALIVIAMVLGIAFITGVIISDFFHIDDGEDDYN